MARHRMDVTETVSDYATPDFLWRLLGFGELHATFLNESRTRGRWPEPRGRKSGAPAGTGWDDAQAFDRVGMG
jgi:hypothetical protein